MAGTKRASNSCSLGDAHRAVRGRTARPSKIALHARCIEA